MLIDQKGRRFDSQLNEEWLEQTQKEIKTDIASQVVKSQTALLKAMLAATDKLAMQSVPDIVDKAKHNAMVEYRQEIDRLVALQQVNPAIRDDEIDHLRQEQELLLQQLGATVAQLDSLRVIVVVQ